MTPEQRAFVESHREIHREHCSCTVKSLIAIIDSIESGSALREQLKALREVIVAVPAWQGSVMYALRENLEDIERELRALLPEDV